MAIFLSVVVFIITFVLLLGSYIVWVANKKIKKKTSIETNKKERKISKNQGNTEKED